VGNLSSVIAYDNYQITPESDEHIIDETVEGFQFSRYLELPKTLNKCLQDCNVKGIKVRHKIKFNVQLHNPDGHISELRANLPVSLYISPSLPLNENNDLVDQSPQAGRAAVQNDINHSAPPLYGEHTLDQLYSDVDPSGYRTPGIGMSTPGTPYTASRRGSADNLASLDAMTNSDGHVSAAALQHRLQDLRSSERNSPSPLQYQQHDDHDQPRSGCLSRRGSQPHNDGGSANGDYFIQPGSVENGGHPRLSPSLFVNGQSSQPDSTAISRQHSTEDDPPSGTRTPFGMTNHFEDLAKVPSYSTAVRTPAPRTSRAVDVSLPSYGAAISEPAPSPPMEPPHAFVRQGSHTNPYFDDLQRSQPRAISTMHDEERRMRMMQIRGR
jgi:hypothetical protein